MGHEEPFQADSDGPSWVDHGRGGKTQEGDDTALAVIVGAHDEANVFDYDDDHQRREHQRQEAQDRLVPGVARRFEDSREV